MIRLIENSDFENLYSCSIEFDQLHIDRNLIQRMIGYPAAGAPEHVMEMIDDVVLQAREQSAIQCGFRLMRHTALTGDHKGLMVNDKEFRVQKIISNQLKNTDGIVIFIMTLGPQMESWSKELMNEGEYLKGYIVDSVASEAIEQAADNMQNQVELYLAGQDIHITNRFSPGYCNWVLAEQSLLFSFFPPEFCGIHLTESMLMIPEKSISGIMGTGRNAENKDYPCKFCDDTHCIRKKIMTGE